jgi:hypothetical protein
MRNINYGVVSNSNQIERVTEDSHGYKLISFCRVFNYPKCKPQYSLSIFADYKDGVLRVFNRHDYSTFNVKSWREAIVLIRNFTDY